MKLTKEQESRIIKAVEILASQGIRFDKLGLTVNGDDFTIFDYVNQPYMKDGFIIQTYSVKYILDQESLGRSIPKPIDLDDIK